MPPSAFSSTCARAAKCFSKDVSHPYIHKFSLTFKDRGLEAGFTQRRTGSLLQGTRAAAVVGVVMGMMAAAMHRAEDKSYPYPNLSYIVVSCYCALVLLISLSPCARRASPRTVEACCLLWFASGSWLLVLSSPWYMARLRGVDPLAVLDESYHSDTGTLMTVDTVVTAVHLMPFRSYLLLPFQINSVLGFMIPAFVLRSPEMDNGLYHSMMLVCLVSLASMGKRSIELQERANFHMMLHEKQLRFQSEFQLSQVMETSAGREAAGESTRQAPSENTYQTQAESGRIFGLGSEHDVSDEALGRIAMIGRREQWLINPDELQLKPQALLGEGGFGVVLRGLYHGSDVAVKAPHQGTSAARSSEVLLELCNELRVMRRLRHPNICFLYGAVLSVTVSMRLCLVLELIDGISLGQFVTARRSPGVLRVSILCEIASALCYLHSRQPAAIIHGDLKDNNIFMQRRRDGWHVKLLDFGLSRVLERSSRPQGGTLRWMAPELLAGDLSPSMATDMFSFGRVIFFVSIGIFPFAEKRGSELRRYLRRNPALRWPKAKAGDLAWHCRPVAEECLQRSSDARPRARSVFDSLTAICRSLEQEDTTPNCNESQLERAEPRELRVAPATQEQIRAFGAFNLPEAVSSANSCGNSALDSVPEGEVSTEGLGNRSITPSESSSRGDRDRTPSQEQVPPLLVHPSRLLTPQESMTRAMAFMMMHFNYRVPPQSCCWIHAGTRALDTARRELAELPCEDAPVPVGGQCKSCYLLCLDDCRGARCVLCGMPVAVGGGGDGPKPSLAERLDEDRGARPLPTLEDPP